MKLEKQIAENYNHLVRDVFTYLEEHFESIVPAGCPDQEIYWRTKKVYEQLEAFCADAADVREVRIAPAAEGSPEAAAGAEVVASYLEDALAYFDQKHLAEHIEDRRGCRNVVLNAMQMIANLAVWLDSLYEDAATACYVKECLALTEGWKVHCVHSGVELQLPLKHS